MSRLQFSVLILTLGLSAACGKDDPTSNNTANNTTAANNTTNTTSTNTSTTNTTNTTSTNNTTPTNNTTNTTSTNNTSATNNTTNTTSTNNTSMACMGAVECFENADCPADQRCEGLGAATPNSLNGCCAVGVRGTKTVGDMCADEDECDTGLCIGRNNDPEICTKLCAGAADCPTPLECHPVLAVCVTPDP